MLCLEAVVGLQCSDQTSLLLSVSSGNGDSNRSQENAASPIAALSSRTRGCDEKDPSTSFVVPRICGDFTREEKRCGEFGILIFDIPSRINSQPMGDPISCHHLTRRRPLFSLHACLMTRNHWGSMFLPTCKPHIMQQVNFCSLSSRHLGYTRFFACSSLASYLIGDQNGGRSPSQEPTPVPFIINLRCKDSPMIQISANC